jgi:hypothetical protein
LRLEGGIRTSEARIRNPARDPLARIRPRRTTIRQSRAHRCMSTPGRSLPCCSRIASRRFMWQVIGGGVRPRIDEATRPGGLPHAARSHGAACVAHRHVSAQACRIIRERAIRWSSSGRRARRLDAPQARPYHQHRRLAPDNRALFTIASIRDLQDWMPDLDEKLLDQRRPGCRGRCCRHGPVRTETAVDQTRPGWITTFSSLHSLEMLALQICVEVGELALPVPNRTAANLPSSLRTLVSKESEHSLAVSLNAFRLSPSLHMAIMVTISFARSGTSNLISFLKK